MFGTRPTNRSLTISNQLKRLVKVKQTGTSLKEERYFPLEKKKRIQ
jgi:hypothetical protein